MPDFQRRHYEAIAEATAASRNIDQLTVKLADLFETDNEHFDRHRFIFAARRS